MPSLGSTWELDPVGRQVGMMIFTEGIVWAQAESHGRVWDSKKTGTHTNKQTNKNEFREIGTCGSKGGDKAMLTAAHKSKHHNIKGLHVTPRVWISSARQQELPDTPHATGMLNALHGSPQPPSLLSQLLAEAGLAPSAPNTSRTWQNHIYCSELYAWQHRSAFTELGIDIRPWFPAGRLWENSSTVPLAAVMLYKIVAYTSLGSPRVATKSDLSVSRKVEINQWWICVLS